MASVPIGDAEFWENRRMAQVASEARFVTTGDGRTLCFAEWGNPDGFPVVFLHGTPGGRLNRHPDEGVYRQLGARWIACPTSPRSSTTWALMSLL
jgi:hypothetical protein